MRILAIAALVVLSGGQAALAQNTVRYFTGVYGLLEDLDTDVILKETRSGAKVISAELDVCFVPTPNSALRDRFVIALKPQGNRLTGSGQSQDGKRPVTVDLARKTAGGDVSFDGKIKYGDREFKASSADNSDISAREFQEQTAVEDTILENPADFREVTPGNVALRVNREQLADVLKALRGEKVQIQAYSIAPSCDALRRGHLNVQVDVDPERATALVAKARSLPGVTKAGWTSGGIDLTRALRIPSANWRDANSQIDRTKIGNAIAKAAASALNGQPGNAEWDEITGELTVYVKRPDATVPGLGLTEVIEVPVVVSAEKPGATETLVIRIGQLSSEIEDEGEAPRLSITRNQSETDSTEPAGSDDVLGALAREMQAEVWDTDKDVWRK